MSIQQILSASTNTSEELDFTAHKINFRVSHRLLMLKQYSGKYSGFHETDYKVLKSSDSRNRAIMCWYNFKFIPKENKCVKPCDYEES